VKDATGRGGTDADQPGALTSVTRAADRVVEVIPGAVVLLLAGLAALVLLLLVRSWLMDRRRVKALEGSYGVTVEALATAIEAKDHTTGGHIERVRRLGLLLAGEVVPREARDPQMEYGFLLHDIGKLAVPDAILRAPGRLTEDEWALMRRHPEEGARMLAAIPFLDRGLEVVRHHHERWDGGGYPDGLAGEEIPLWARIFAVVDALDAMTAERPYRPGRSYESALAEIRQNAGTQFDPAVVEELARIDKARIEPLLEPTQQLGTRAEPEVTTVTDLGPLIPA
jgi:ribonuclease P protein subunit RPR2